jgi:outer membrane biosynthesis protein TonB
LAEFENDEDDWTIVAPAPTATPAPAKPVTKPKPKPAAKAPPSSKPATPEDGSKR